MVLKINILLFLKKNVGQVLIDLINFLLNQKIHTKIKSTYEAMVHPVFYIYMQIKILMYFLEDVFLLFFNNKIRIIENQVYLTPEKDLTCRS